MKTRWNLIIPIWFATAFLAIAVMVAIPGKALTWFGAILAGSVALVSLIHLIKASPTGFVKELIYVGGGAYLILAALSLYLFLGV